MKKRFILFSALLGIGYLTLSSYISNPGIAGAGDCTGATSTITCARSGCHSSSSATTNNGITLIDKATSTPVTSGVYTPGKIYTVTLTGTNSSALPKFGFQVCAVNASKASVGTISNIPTNTSADAVGTKKILEQTIALSGTVAAGTAAYVISFDWTAPASGTGTVTFNSIINAVNGDNSTSGDGVSTQISKVFTENTTSVAELSAQIQSKVYPNPASYWLNIGLENATTGNYNMQVSDINGKTVLSQNEIVNSSSFVSSLNIASLAQGNYFLRIENNNTTRVVPFIKK